MYVVAIQAANPSHEPSLSIHASRQGAQEQMEQAQTHAILFDVNRDLSSNFIAENDIPLVEVVPHDNKP